MNKSDKLFILIVILFLLTLSTVLSYQSKSKDEIISLKEEEIKELQEKVDYYETELKCIYSDQDIDYESYSIE